MNLSALLASRKVLLADGATGTNLFAMGLTSGDSPELWNDTHPDKLRALHQRFVDAGADIILTNSFGGNRRRLKLHALDGRTRELNRKAARLAREVADQAGRPVIVAGSVGPTGDLLAPLGTLSEAEAVEIFVEQIEGLKEGGADVVWIETMSAVEEIRAAATAAARVGMPYTITASFDTAGRTMMGIAPRALLDMTTALLPPPIAAGANCGVGASDLVMSVLAMTETPSPVPLIAKANAGIPRLDGPHVHYSGTPELMARYAELAIDAGARIIGGCCGTSPEHLAAMRRAIDAHVAAPRPDLDTVVSALGPLVAPPPKSDAGARRPRKRERPSRTRTLQASGPMRRLENPWSPIEILNQDQLARIIAGAYVILEEAGLEIRSPAAREIYRRNGALVDDATQMVRIGREIVTAHCGKAPERFVLHARNPTRHLHVGGNVVNFGPVNGTPHVTDIEGGRRYGTIEDFRSILKVTHHLGVLHWQGGVVTEPVDLPVPIRHLEMYLAHAETTDIVWAARGVGGVQASDAIAMSAIEHGVSVEQLGERPTLLSVTNVNSPRRVDEEILDNIMIMAAHGQCVCITPFTLMGAMAPITLGGALVQQTAEALGIIALVQMIRPGCPAVFGGFTSNVDMRSGSPAMGTPEYVQATLAGAQIARALKLPYRSSAVCSSPAADAQAAWETGLSLWASIMSHSHLINHATGWLEGGLAASFEKVIMDAEMLRGWAEILKPITLSDDDLALDAIKEVPPGGHFFGSPHTIARYETAFWRPIVSDWSNFENWRDQGSKDALKRSNEVWKKTLAAYEQPPFDPAVNEALREFVAKRRAEIGA
jgi:trimethylamine---corrinoid protein Co-methyltransferase